MKIHKVSLFGLCVLVSVDSNACQSAGCAPIELAGVLVSVPPHHMTDKPQKTPAGKGRWSGTNPYQAQDEWVNQCVANGTDTLSGCIWLYNNS